LFISACGIQPQTPTTPALQPVTLNLQWFTQAQFAGYYVALEKGWYQEQGIDLNIVPGGPDILSTDSVLAGTADFGTSLLADIIVAIESGKPLISIAQIQQSNGLLLIAQAASGIQTPKDFAGKRVGVWLGNWEAQFDALIAKEGLKPGDYELVSQGFSMDAFIKGELDVASAMIYNEYHVVIESGFKPEDITIIDYADYGLDFPGDVLFTSQKTSREQPELCKKMLIATLKGWQYAVDHPDEAVDIVLKYDITGTLTRDHQVSMMNEIKKLVQLTVRPLGFTDRDDLRRTIDTLYTYKVLSKLIQPEEVFTNEFWEQAQSALK
jgi:NitT/TauT family transport system substrate-binding protein